MLRQSWQQWFKSWIYSTNEAVWVNNSKYNSTNATSVITSTKAACNNASNLYGTKHAVYSGDDFSWRMNYEQFCTITQLVFARLNVWLISPHHNNVVPISTALFGILDKCLLSISLIVLNLLNKIDLMKTAGVSW